MSDFLKMIFHSVWNRLSNFPLVKLLSEQTTELQGIEN